MAAPHPWPPRELPLREFHQGTIRRVLTTPQLFRLVSQWTIRWPQRLADRWRAFHLELQQHEALRLSRGFAIRKARQIELFMREIMVSGDADTLRLAVRSMWQDDDGVMRAFPVHDLQFAVRSGDAATLGIALQHATVRSECKRSWLWKEAFDHFPGHCRVLDVLIQHIDPVVNRDYDFTNLPQVLEWLHTRTGDAGWVTQTTVIDGDGQRPTKRARLSRSEQSASEQHHHERPDSNDKTAPGRTAVAQYSGTERNAAFRVLASPQLLPLIPQWRTGWPARVTERWAEIGAARASADAIRTKQGFAVSSERKVELFMRELVATGDLATLRLASKCMWRDKNGHLHCFRVRDLQFAIRAGHSETVRWALEHLSQSVHIRDQFPRSKIAWFWNEAMDHSPNNFALLDAMNEFIQPPIDLWRDTENKIKTVAQAQWFVDNVGPACLPPSMIVTEAANGNLELVRYLSTVAGQDVAAAVSQASFCGGHVREFLQKLAPVAQTATPLVSLTKGWPSLPRFSFGGPR